MIDLQPELELTVGEAELILSAWLRRPATCTEIVRLEGGMVNSVFLLEFDHPPHRAVIKLHTSETDTFADEAVALSYLRAETACPVPSVYLHDSSARLVRHAFLLLEAVPGVSLKGLDLEPTERADIERQLADVLGELHRHTGTRWGRLDGTEDGVTWPDVFVARLAEARSYPAVGERLSPTVLGRVDEAIELARPALADASTPTLVHGDVWDGNLIVQRNAGGWQLTGLLDPDLQFADAEYELAYLEVFDNQQPAFFDAYAEHHELRPGYEIRRRFYWLHTALVHVGLFGDEFFCDFTARTAEQIARHRTQSTR